MRHCAPRKMIAPAFKAFSSEMGGEPASMKVGADSKAKHWSWISDAAEVQTA